jgi:hypothetical protein
MSRELLKQALYALKYHSIQTRPIDLTNETIEALRQELAKPEQEKPLPPVDIGVDVTPEGTHVVACYNRPDAVQEMFYSQFHPLAKPEQEPIGWFLKDHLETYMESYKDIEGAIPLYTAPPSKAVGRAD